MFTYCLFIISASVVNGLVSLWINKDEQMLFPFTQTMTVNEFIIIIATELNEGATVEIMSNGNLLSFQLASFTNFLISNGVVHSCVITGKLCIFISLALMSILFTFLNVKWFS